MPGKEFTSFDVAATVRELKLQIPDSLVSNVYQLDAKTFLLKLHKVDKPTLWLVLQAGKRMNLTAYAAEKPSRPPSFCMALRKYLRNARLVGIEQYEFERVVVFSFTVQGSSILLVLELFGDGNIVLVGQNGKILHALSYKRMRDRNIIRDETLKFAPSSGKNPLKMKIEEFQEGLRSFRDAEVVRAIARFLSIGGTYAEEVLARVNLPKATACSRLSFDDVKAVFESLQNLLSQVEGGTLDPCIVQDESGSFVDVVPLRLKRYEAGTFRIQPYATFNEALDEYYSKTAALEQAAQGAEIEKYTAEAARLERIITEQKKVLASAEAETQECRLIGDAIYGHFSDLQVLLERFLSDKKSGRDWKDIVSEVLSGKQKSIQPWVLFESFASQELGIKVCVNGLTFSLDLRKTLFDNAAGFYERSKRARQKMQGAQAALNESMRRLQEVEARMNEAKALQVVKPAEAIRELEERKLKRKEWFEKFRWFVSSDGFLVVAGKDAVTNEVLIKKYTDPRDVVFHADIVGAPFVVVKTKGEKPKEQFLREAGEFAAAFSRGWREGFASIDVFWVRPDQLSKGGPSGESVGHGAFAVKGGRNWMRGTPLRVAVGVAFDEEAGIARIGGGPVEAVKAKTSAYVVIVPGDIEGKELFKLVLKRLVAKVPKELSEVLQELSVESIREFIPFAKGTILEG